MQLNQSSPAIIILKNNSQNRNYLILIFLSKKQEVQYLDNQIRGLKKSLSAVEKYFIRKGKPILKLYNECESYNWTNYWKESDACRAIDEPGCCNWNSHSLEEIGTIVRNSLFKLPIENFGLKCYNQIECIQSEAAEMVHRISSLDTKCHVNNKL